MSVVLVHGYAGETRVPIFRSPLDETAGFLGLRSLVESGEAHVFAWGVPRDLTLAEAFNPATFKSIYENEQEIVMQEEAQKCLYTFLERHKAITVVGHSLGARYIYEMAKHIGVPNCVQRVVWVQGGVDASLNFQGLFPELVNLYCPWDPTLLLSALFFHQSFRAGLCPIRGAKNHLFPLWRLPNLHTSSQKSPQLKRWLV